MNVNRQSVWPWTWLLLLVGFALPLAARSAPPDAAPRPGSQWLRLKRDRAGTPVALQTAIVHYVSRRPQEKDLSVDLIGALHVADRGYYQRLNRRFRHYDALLYELVAPPGLRVERGRGTSNTNPIGAMQNAVKNILQLDHQLEQIDYTRDNFVHADMSPEQMSRAMADRGESMVQMLFRLLGQGIAQQSGAQAKGKTSNLDLFSALLARHPAVQLKRVMAEQFEGMESMLAGLGGADGSTLIEGRNQIALRVLKREIGRGRKKLGIFYGAGHLADMDKRLRSEFHFEPVRVEWLTAWDLRDAE